MNDKQFAPGFIDMYKLSTITLSQGNNIVKVDFRRKL